MLLRSYQEFPNFPWFQKEDCQNITTPCWIPHAANIIESISTNMPICDSLNKYTCMLSTMKAAISIMQEQCPKSCKSETYKTLTTTADIEPFTRVGNVKKKGTKIES